MRTWKIPLLSHFMSRLEEARLKRDSSQMRMWNMVLHSQQDFQAWAKHDAELIQSRRSLQHRLETELPKEKEGIYSGFCSVCGSHSRFTYDWLYSSNTHVNWRERLVCNKCHLSNRLRLSLTVAKQTLPALQGSIYLTEQLTPLASTLKKINNNLICSEFLGPNFKSGYINASGVRHEDLTCLSFKDNSFDLVLSFDVLEHVPDYKAGLREVRRVLRSNGSFIFTVPLYLGSAKNIVRAKLDTNGEVEHLLPAEYHGDPVNSEGGILCFYHFGWEILDDLRSCGFSNAAICLYWSSDFAHIGDEQALIIASA